MHDINFVAAENVQEPQVSNTVIIFLVTMKTKCNEYFNQN